MATKKSSSKRQSMTRKAPSKPRRPSCGCGGESGQGMSITTIIIAALGLIVLVVLIVIFTGQTGKFTKGTTEIQGGTVCETSLIYPSGVTGSLGGRWQDQPCEPGYTEATPTYPADAASHGGQKCCVGAALGARPSGVSGPAP